MSWRLLIHLALLLAATGAGISEGLAPASIQIPASEILSRMADGQPVHCEGASLTGDLNLSTLPGARAEKDAVPERVTFRNALFFSTMIFLSQGPIDFLPVGRHRYYVILEGIIGWLLLALFLVTLERVMIR